MSDTALVGEIRDVDFADALGERYLSYALSTIMARSLPDVRDGLKPVHRRILHAMHELRLDPGSGYKKCARVVGDVIGKFHPHGELAVYEALVRLAQDFAQRYPLVDGQGNFGNIDGDNAAAMRYTESRLSAVAQAMLEGHRRGRGRFPHRPMTARTASRSCLPGRFPNLLANGAAGIAVGMATSIPPHNAGELCGALLHLIDHPDCPTAELVRACHRPRFSDRRRARRAGRKASPRPMRPAAAASACGRAGTKEPLSHGLYQIVVTEIPYQVPKSRLIEKIAALLEEKKLPLLADIRDESAERGPPRPRAEKPQCRSRRADGAAVPADRAGSPRAAQPQRDRPARRAAGDEPEGGAAGVSRPSPRGACSGAAGTGSPRSRGASRCCAGLSSSISISTR